MHFRNEIFIYQIFIALFVPSLAGNLSPNDKPDTNDIQCNDTESIKLLKNLRNVQQFKKPDNKVVVVLTDSEGNMYGPLRNELLKNDAFFLQLNKTFSTDIKDIYKYIVFLNSVPSIKFLIHSDNIDKVAYLFQHLTSIFRNVSEFHNSVGFALTSDNTSNKDLVVSKLYNIARQLNKTNLVEMIDSYSIPKGPIAIFNNQSLNNPDVNTFLQDIHYTGKDANQDNFKFILQEEFQTKINCATAYVQKQVISDMNSFVKNQLKSYFDDLIEQIQYNLSKDWKEIVIERLRKDVDNLPSFIEKISSVQNPRRFLESLENTFRYTFHEVEFEETYFLQQNIDAIQFLYLMSNYEFASAIDEWTKPFKDFKMQIPHSLEQWYQKKEEYFETKCAAISRGIKQQVRGTIVPLDQINVHQCGPNTKLLEIFAIDKVIVNVDLKFIGREMEVVIVAPVWKVIDWITIDLSGANATEFAKSKASNGNKDGNRHGCDGKAGSPGGSAGNFIGVANRIVNANQLSILANGGKGGKGQDGGHGADGEDGECLKSMSNFDCATGTAAGHAVTLKKENTVGGRSQSTVYKYVVHGTKGINGGNGGNGGTKGLGGYMGNIILFDLSEIDGNSATRIATFDGEPGTHGRGGFLGHGGKNGLEAKLECSSLQYAFQKTFRNLRFNIDNTDRGYAKSGVNGADGISLSSRSMPKTVAILQNFPHTINEYKFYVRPELAKINDSENNILSFYQLLNTRKEIISLYNTLTLVEEFTGLEQQGFDLEDQQHLIPSFEALKTRFYNYYIKPNYEKEKASVYQDVHKEMYRLIIGKLETIQKRKGYPVIANILRELKDNGLQQIKKLEEQEDVNSKLQTFNENIKPLDGLIEQAESFINNNLHNAMKDIQSALDQKINTLLEEISKLKKNSREKEKELFASRKELRRIIVLKQLFGILKVGCALAGLVHPAIGMAGTVLSTTLSVVEPHVTQTNISTKVAEVPKAIKALSTATEEYLKPSEKDAVQESQISKIMMDATPSGKDMINRMREKIKNAFKKTDSEPVLLSYKSLDRNEVYIKQEAAMTIKMEEAKKNKDVKTENDCKVGMKVLKIMKVGGEVLQTVSDTFTSVMENEGKIDEIEKAIKESRENFKKLNIMEEKVYNEALPMLTKVIGFTDQVSDDVGKLNQNELIIANWDVSNTIEKVQKSIQKSFDGFNTTKEMNTALDKLVSTYKVMSEMQKQVLEYGEKKSQIEFLAMMHLPKEREILAVDRHLVNELAKLNTASIYNRVNDFYKQWIFAFKQFSFPNGGDILKLREWPDAMTHKDVKHVIKDMKTNVENLNELLIEESKYDYLLKNRAPRLFRGSCSLDKTSFFVWSNESTGTEIDNILSGRKTTIVAKTPTSGINALKFKKVGILFTAKNSSIHQKFFNIMGNVRVNLTHHGDSIYRFNNKTFEIKTNPIDLTFNYPLSVNEVMRLPSSLYEKISNGAYMLSPYATWTIKLISEDATVFESLNEFKGQVDLELIGEGQVFENNQCDKECEENMMKYYKFTNEI